MDTIKNIEGVEFLQLMEKFKKGKNNGSQGIKTPRALANAISSFWHKMESNFRSNKIEDKKDEITTFKVNIEEAKEKLNPIYKELKDSETSIESKANLKKESNELVNTIASNQKKIEKNEKKINRLQFKNLSNILVANINGRHLTDAEYDMYTATLKESDIKPVDNVVDNVVDTAVKSPSDVTEKAKIDIDLQQNLGQQVQKIESESEKDNKTQATTENGNDQSLEELGKKFKGIISKADKFDAMEKENAQLKQQIEDQKKYVEEYNAIKADLDGWKYSESTMPKTVTRMKSMMQEALLAIGTKDQVVEIANRERETAKKEALDAIAEKDTMRQALETTTKERDTALVEVKKANEKSTIDEQKYKVLEKILNDVMVQRDTISLDATQLANKFYEFMKGPLAVADPSIYFGKFMKYVQNEQQQIQEPGQQPKR